VPEFGADIGVEGLDAIILGGDDQPIDDQHIMVDAADGKGAEIQRYNGSASTRPSTVTVKSFPWN
jgi:hypothetical protein